MDMQALLDALSDASARERSNYHLTLGAAIEALSALPPETPLVVGDTGVAPGDVDSYRGYYSDLAFEPNGDLATAGAALANLRAALGETFTGYKGGDFQMTERTPLWVSPYGCASGEAVTGLEVKDGTATLLVRRVD